MSSYILRSGLGGADQMSLSSRLPIARVCAHRAFSTSSNPSKIIVLAGDGIGEEVTRESVKVLQALPTGAKFDFESHLIGGAGTVKAPHAVLCLVISYALVFFSERLQLIE